MSDENKQELGKLSFWQLLETTSVEIPIIQRDYAQGRATKEKVRNDFLDALYNALTTNAPVELDFVYGSEEKNILQPLDGQQRLTTLFLLHWFIANKEGKLESAKERLSKFTYETRTSSREFCKELVNKSIDYKNDNQLSKTIKNASWFVISWKKDPTISAMLIMLDAIQSKFKDSSGLWEKLIETEDEKRPITFLYIELKDFGLSDDLYIKMNARGKQLTPFENFKSRFIKHIEKWEEGITNPQEKFAHKIDTVWTDLFWKYRGDDNLIDNEMINFIAGIAINYYAQRLEIQPNEDEETRVRKELEEKGKTKTVSDETVKRERVERRMKVLFNNPNEINPKDFSTKESFEYLIKCLDTYYQNNYAELKPNVDLWKYCKITLFKDIIQNEKTEWQNRAVFYAQTIYLLNYPESVINTDDTNFNDWMRVIRNIAENSTIDDATPFIAAINLIKELSSGCSNIYKYLSTNKVTAGHARDQIKEEIGKAKIIISNPDAKQIIHDTEDTNFCKGKIDFALYCTDYDIEKANPTEFNKNKLAIIKTILERHLNTDNKIEDNFKRALLTVKNNCYYDVWGSWSSSFNCNKNWLLHTNKDLKEHFRDNNWRDYLKDLVVLLFDKDCKQICQDFVIPTEMPNWKQRLIKESGLLNGATFILVPNDNSYCRLAWQQRPSREDQVKKIE